MSLTPGGPAARSDLLAGDVVIAVDGTPTANMRAEDFVDQVVGPTGSLVTFTVNRSEETLSIEVERGPVLPDPP